MIQDKEKLLWDTASYPPDWQRSKHLRTHSCLLCVGWEGRKHINIMSGKVSLVTGTYSRSCNPLLSIHSVDTLACVENSFKVLKKSSWKMEIKLSLFWCKIFWCKNYFHNRWKNVSCEKRMHAFIVNSDFNCTAS